MRSTSTKRPDQRDPVLVGLLYRSTSVPEVPSTKAKRLAVVGAIGILVLALVCAIIS